MSENRRNFIVWCVSYPSGLLARIGNRPAAFLTRKEARRHVHEVPYGLVTKFVPVREQPRETRADTPVDAQRERRSSAEDYLHNIVDAFEAWKKLADHPPETPTDEHDERIGDAWNTLEDTLNEAADARCEP